MNLAEEYDLLQAIQADPKQFGILFDLYYKQIFGYILRRTGNYDIACDIAAETFLKAFLKIEHYTWKNISLASWLYKIATNEIGQHFRKNKLFYFSTPLLDEEQLQHLRQQNSISDREVIEQELKTHDEFMEVQKHLKELSLKYQEVIALRYFEDKSIKEIAGILDKNEGTVKSLLSRGIEKLRILMQPATR